MPRTLKKNVPNYIKTLRKVIEHYGSRNKLAEKLRISKQYIGMICMKGTTPLQALKIEMMTKGKFKTIDLLKTKDKNYLMKKANKL